MLEGFPIAGEGFEVQLVGEAGDEATLRLVIYEEAGSVRDIKEQTFVVLPERHRDARGAQYLAATRAHIAGLAAADLEAAMPMELFAPQILDVPDLAGEADFARVLADPRARHILALPQPDPALLATVDPRRHPAVPVLANAELEARLVERPDDRDLAAVYGDWLAERGDPRGELVAVQLARELDPADERLRARERELLHTYAYEWLAGYAWLPASDLAVTWRRGFPHRIVIGSEDYGTEDSVGDLGVGGLARLPSPSLLRELELRPHSFWIEDYLVELGSPGYPEHWTRLVIETPEYEHLGNLEPAYPNLARLRELVIQSRSMELGELELPALRSLELITRGLTADNLRSIRHARWTALERLVLWLGDFELHDCDITLDELGWILEAENLGTVRELGLCGREPADLLERLAAAPILRQLEVLDLAGSFLDDAGAQFLHDHAAAFAHLRQLRVPRPYTGTAPALPPNAVIDERFLPVYE